MHLTANINLLGHQPAILSMSTGKRKQYKKKKDGASSNTYTKVFIPQSAIAHCIQMKLGYLDTHTQTHGVYM